MDLTQRRRSDFDRLLQQRAGFFESTLAKSPEVFKTILGDEFNKKLGDINSVR